MHRLLITGAAGGLGKMLRKSLKDWADIVRLSDIKDMGPAAEGEEIVQCDLGDLQAVKALVKDVDAIVHLGGISLEDSFETILNANIRGSYNLFEAARLCGGPRILFASSNHTIGFYRRDQKLGKNVQQKPDSIYGVSKCFGEALASFYYNKFKVESVCVRIGSCFPEPLDRRMLATWLSPADFVELVKCIFRAPVVGSMVMYGVSDNKECWWDNSEASFLGWQPKDSSEPYREKMERQTLAPDGDDPAVIFQGGKFASAGHPED